MRMKVGADWQRLHALRAAIPLLLGVLVAGCSALPGQGPSAMDMALLEVDDAPLANDYAVVPLNDTVMRILGTPQASADLSATFGPDIRGKSSAGLVVGDRLAITIWEASPDGLFSTTNRKETPIDATVDELGNIYIPYVEKISVAGRSVERVRQAIEDGLVGKAVEPRVQVALAATGGNKVSVVGDVARPGRFDIPLGGLRLIEALAEAGGSRLAGFESEVIVVRGPKRGAVRLGEVVRHQHNNIWLKAGDTIEIRHRPSSFTAFGAVTAQKHLPFTTETVSLAEALARSGGLRDNLADAGGVFLLRFESPSRLKKAGVAVPSRNLRGKVATIYRLDFNQPQAFFLAGAFLMQDKDIIYVANAPATEFRKFISLIVAPFFGTANSAASLAN